MSTNKDNIEGLIKTNKTKVFHVYRGTFSEHPPDRKAAKNPYECSAGGSLLEDY